MNSAHFEAWWTNSVLPNLPDKSVVVIDNASYHSRQTEESKNPTKKWRKAKIQDWLRQQSISFGKKDTIPILLSKAKERPLQKKFVLEELTREYCEMANKRVIVLRLPIGHSELNPIELIWAQIKSEVARKNSKFTLTSVKKLVEEAMKTVTAQNWMNCLFNPYGYIISDLAAILSITHEQRVLLAEVLLTHTP